MLPAERFCVFLELSHFPHTQALAVGCRPLLWACYPGALAEAFTEVEEASGHPAVTQKGGWFSPEPVASAVLMTGSAYREVCSDDMAARIQNPAMPTLTGAIQARHRVGLWVFPTGALGGSVAHSLQLLSGAGEPRSPPHLRLSVCWTAYQERV